MAEVIIDNCQKVEVEIDVLFPTFDDYEGLSDMLESFASQTFKEFILHISDNTEENTDNINIVKSYAGKINIKYYHHGKNIGGISNHNFLLSVVSSSYYCFVNTDDRINNEYFESLIGVAREHGCCIVAPKLYQYLNGKLDYEGYSPNTSGPFSSLWYCLSRSKYFPRLEGVYYGLIRNCKSRPMIADRLGTANKFILECSLLGAIKTAEGAKYMKYYDDTTRARHARLNRIGLFTCLHKISRIPEIYFYIALNVSQALANYVLRNVLGLKVRHSS